MGVHQYCCKPSSWRKHDQDDQEKVKVGGHLVSLPAFEATKDLEECLGSSHIRQERISR